MQLYILPTFFVTIDGYISMIQPQKSLEKPHKGVRQIDVWWAKCYVKSLLTNACYEIVIYFIESVIAIQKTPVLLCLYIFPICPIIFQIVA